MDLVTLANDPRVQMLAAALGAMALSSAHAYLDKHPRLQATLRVVAHFTGPLNLPAMKAAAITLCRAVVAAEDNPPRRKSDDVLKTLIINTVRGPDGSSTTSRTVDSPPTADGVKEWPQR